MVFSCTNYNIENGDDLSLDFYNNEVYHYPGNSLQNSDLQFGSWVEDYQFDVNFQTGGGGFASSSELTCKVKGTTYFWNGGK